MTCRLDSQGMNYIIYMLANDSGDAFRNAFLSDPAQVLTDAGFDAEDDDFPDPLVLPSQAEIVTALASYVAELQSGLRGDDPQAFTLWK